MLRQIRGRWKRNSVHSADLQPVDAATLQLTHGGNVEIFDFFRRNSSWNANVGMYDRLTRTDLAEGLDDLITKTGIGGKSVKAETVYGRRIIANSNGLVFAWAAGTWDFFFRLPNERTDAAYRDGARLDLTYPPGWLNFYLLRLGDEWPAILEHWFKISYQDSLNNDR